MDRLSEVREFRVLGFRSKAAAFLLGFVHGFQLRCLSYLGDSLLEHGRPSGFEVGIHAAVGFFYLWS